MAGLDLNKLKEQQEILKKRGGDGSKNWIALRKLEDETLDFRILDPLPSMEGIYYLEVPVWWIKGERLISPKLIDFKMDKDAVDLVLDEARKAARNDSSLSQLLNAKNENKMPIIQSSYEYWIPVLKFDWKYQEDRSGNKVIVGITNEKGEYDLDAIRKFIVDDRVKFLQANVTCLKAINTILTTRGMGGCLERVNGRNMQLQKTGKGKETKYSVLPMEQMPMPQEFYTAEKFTDPLDVAKALIMSDEYMASVIEKYLYGDVEIPNKDEHYRFPEIHERLKNKYKDNDEDAQPKAQRPGRTRINFDQAPAEEAPAPAPTRQAPAAPVQEIAPAPVSRRGRPAGTRRDLASDLKDVR